MTTKAALGSMLTISLTSFLITAALCMHFYRDNYPGTDTGDLALGLIMIFFLPLWAFAAMLVAGPVLIFMALSKKSRTKGQQNDTAS